MVQSPLVRILSMLQDDGFDTWLHHLLGHCITSLVMFPGKCKKGLPLRVVGPMQLLVMHHKTRRILSEKSNTVVWM